MLEQAGIATELRNEFAIGAAGGLAPLDTWPELWLDNERQRQQAEQLIAEFKQEDEKPDWRCRHCGHPSPDSFEYCWHCGVPR